MSPRPDRRVHVIAAAGVALALLVWLFGRGSGAPQAEDARTRAPDAAVPAPGLAASPAPSTMPTTAATPRPASQAAVEGAGPAPPAGALRVVLRLPERREWQTTVVVTVSRGAEHATTFAWASYRKEPWMPASVASLGTHAAFLAEPPSGRAGEVSCLLTDVDEGAYVVHARLHSGEGTRATAATRVVVEGPAGATAVLTLPPERGAASLVVRVRRAERAFAAKAKLLLDGLTIEAFEATGDEGALLSVPAEVDLDVVVMAFEGSEVLPLPAPVRVLLAPGEKRTVTLELAAGIEVTLQAVGSQGTERAFPSLWRLPPGESPSYVSNVMTVTTAPSTWAGRLPPGRYAASITNGRVRGWTEFEVTPPGPVVARVELRPEPGRPLHLRATEADGTPIRHLQITVVRQDATTFDDLWAHTVRTDEDGRATTPPLTPATYGLFLWNRDLHRRLEVTDETTEEVALRLPAAPPPDGPVFRVRVRPPEGFGRQNGIAGAVIVTALGAEWGILAKVGGDGIYSARGLPAGAARLEIPSTWYARTPYRTHEQPVRVSSGEEPPVEVALRAR
jgi:hypothetical protein